MHNYVYKLVCMIFIISNDKSTMYIGKLIYSILIKNKNTS